MIEWNEWRAEKDLLSNFKIIKKMRMTLNRQAEPSPVPQSRSGVMPTPRNATDKVDAGSAQDVVENSLG